jgi:hypothetical protein
MDAIPQRPRIRTDLITHEIDGEAILYDPAANLTHLLNETGLFIWQHCDGTRTAEEIAIVLTGQYDVTIDIARLDVRSAIERMWDNLLLQTVELAPRK